MFDDFGMGEDTDPDEWCAICDEEITDDNRSHVTDEYGREVCVGCTTECRGCGEGKAMSEMLPNYDYDGQDYCTDCHKRYKSCIESARDSYEEAIIEAGQAAFEDGMWR
jgi:hypothetical protein